MVFCSIRFQGKTHDMAVQNLMALYWPILKANWTYLSLLVFINIKFVPPMVSLRQINCKILWNFPNANFANASISLYSCEYWSAIWLDLDGWSSWLRNVESCKINRMKRRGHESLSRTVMQTPARLLNVAARRIDLIYTHGTQIHSSSRTNSMALLSILLYIIWFRTNYSHCCAALTFSFLWRSWHFHVAAVSHSHTFLIL